MAALVDSMLLLQDHLARRRLRDAETIIQRQIDATDVGN